MFYACAVSLYSHNICYIYIFFNLENDQCFKVLIQGRGSENEYTLYD